MADRVAVLQDFADHISQQGVRMVLTECMDAGQILGYAKIIVMWASLLMRNLSTLALTKFPMEEEIPASGNAFSPGREFVRREPVGVCVGIVPWNFPTALAMWKIAPALIMGNTIVVKPASNTPLTALILAEAAKAAGIPPGVFNVIPGPGGALGNTLCTHPDVDKVAFTGSTEVGREIMRMASATVKKVTLELGGKSANIILDDADMDLAVDGACFGTFLHQGQICESGTRVLVPSKIYDEFVERMKKRAEAMRIGYQLDPTSHMGPVVSKEQLATVEHYVNLGKEEGAEVITGGKRAEVKGFEGGYYYTPTIFANVDNKMRIAQEEIFGPVVCVIKYDSDEEAIAIANDSIYGLAGGVFSSNIARAERVARGVRTGTMWINNYHVFAEYCPFGGYKQSGVGRELGHWGLEEYTQVKRIHVPYYSDRHTNASFVLLSDDKKIEGFNYNCPTNIVAGHGSLSSIYKLVVDQGCRRALILTDPGVRKAGLADLVKNSLVDFCVGIYDNIPQDPDLESVDGATAMAREAQRRLHRQRWRRQRHRCRQGRLRRLEERRQGKRLHQPLVDALRAANPAHRRSDDSGDRQRSDQRGRHHQQDRRPQAVHRRPEDHAERRRPRSAVHHDPAPGHDGRQCDGRHDPRRRGQHEPHGESDVRRSGLARHPADQSRTCRSSWPTARTRRPGSTCR